MEATVAAAIEALRREGRLDEAARLAAEHGADAEASQLWEEHCDFDAAARAALRVAVDERALLLATRARDPQLSRMVLARLAEDEARARVVAERLGALRRHALAARVFAAARSWAAAARAHEQERAWLRAGVCYARAGERGPAERCLRAAIEGDREGDARLRLASLLHAQRRFVEAAEQLQRLTPAHAVEPQVRALLRDCFVQLEMHEAARLVAPESLGPEPNLAVAALPDEPEFADGTGEPGPAVAEPSTLLFGRYRVLGPVAASATARVVQAEDRVTGAAVALKLFAGLGLRGSGRDAFAQLAREARALSTLDHPHVLPVLAWIDVLDTPALVLPWMENGTLAERLRERTLSAAEAVRVTLQVLSALSEAHRRGVLHRDVKPSNVLFDAHDQVKLADFGAAHLADRASTVTEGLLGTWAYMAPELRRGGKASVASDVYSAGALLWHALTGAPPDAQLPLPREGLSEAHRAVLRRLVGDIEQRPPDAATARRLLESLEWSESATLPHPAPPTPSRTTPASRWRALPDGAYWDTWLERRVQRCPATEETLNLARAFCRAGVAGLTAVLGMTPERDAIWVEALPCAEPNAKPGVGLRRALERVLAAGGQDDSLTPRLRRRGDELVWGFPVASAEPHD